MMRPVQLLLLITGEPMAEVSAATGIPGFLDLFAAATPSPVEGDDDEDGPPTAMYRALDLRNASADDPLPDLSDIDGVVMTGSSAMVGENAPWMAYAGRVARHLVQQEVPFLGVCFGHQVLAKAMGGQVGPNVNGRAIGVVGAEKTKAGRDCPLMAHLKDPLHVAVSHRDVVQKLPEGASVLAEASHDPFFALRYGESAWTVQYHPEFSTEFARAYIEARADRYETEIGPGSVDAALATLVPAPDGPSTLAGFTAFVARRRGPDR